MNEKSKVVNEYLFSMQSEDEKDKLRKLRRKIYNLFAEKEICIFGAGYNFGGV